MKNNCIAIIPARGGSKRIPRKNIKPFLGIPIIKYSIDAALLSNCFDEVMVSTEDKEIAEIALSYGAKIPFYRSLATAGDYVSTVDVLMEVLSNYKTKFGMKFEYLCCIYPTAPFTTPEKVRRCMDILIEKGADSIFPITRFSYPIQRSLKIVEDEVYMNWPENYSLRSQDITPAYHDCGQFYGVKTAIMMEQKRLFCGHALPFIVPESEVQDIDTEEDWKIAEIKYSWVVQKQG